MGYVTVDEVKNFLHNYEYDDPQLQEIIDRESDLLDEMAGMSYSSTSQVSEIYDGNGLSFLVLKKKPVVSVDNIYVYENGEWTEYPTTNAELSGNMLILQPADGTGLLYAFPEGNFNIKITYTHGYSEVPAFVKQYILLKIANELVGELPEEYGKTLRELESYIFGSQFRIV